MDDSSPKHTPQQFIFTLLAVVVLVVLAFLLQSDVINGPYAVGQVVQRGTSGFVKTVLDSSTSYSSASAAMTVDQKGRPVIAYYTGYDKSREVKFIRCGDLSCAKGNVVRVLVKETSFPNRVNVRINKNGFPVIGYALGAADWPFDYIIINCGDPDCTTSSRSKIHPGNSDYFWEAILRIGADGNPMIFFGFGNRERPGYPSYEIGAIHCLDTTCAEYDVNIVDTVVDQSGAERFESIDAMIDADGFPAFSYFHHTPAEPRFYYFKFTKCADEYCVAGSESVIIDPYAWPQANSLVLGADGLPRIVYLELVDNYYRWVRVVTCGNSACNFGNVTNSFRVPYLYTGQVAVTISKDGLPAILYETDRYQHSLYLAVCVDAKCEQPPRITLIEPDKYLIWFSDVVSVGLSADHNIAVDRSNRPAFIYQVLATENNQNASLKFVRCLNDSCQ